MFNLRALFHKKRAEQEMDDELRFHLYKQIEQNIAQGMSAEEARYAALRQFGNVGAIKEECRDSWGARFINELAQDLRYGLRQLRRSPGFTVVAILTLALGIGATTAIFSVVNAVLLHPLPFKNSKQLVMLWQRVSHFGTNAFTTPDFLAWKRQTTIPIAAIVNKGFNLRAEGTSEHVPGSAISADFFPLLGVKPIAGRDFLPDEDQSGGRQVVILSYGLWQWAFGGDPAVLGKPLDLNGKPFTVVGIMPRNYWNVLQPDTQLWVPLESDPAFAATRQNRSVHGLLVVGRLKAGMSLKQARAAIPTIAGNLGREYTQTDARLGVDLVPLANVVVGSARPALLVLFAAVGFVLLIACSNVANLLLGRATARTRELTVRIAVGAGRRRLVKQLLTESLLLASLGGAAGLFIAFWGLRLLHVLNPGNIPHLEKTGIDPVALGFTAALCVMTGMLFGVVPAFQASKTDLNETLKESGGSFFPSSRRSRLRHLLVVSEGALALMLLVGAGLMIRSFRYLEQAPMGFSPHGLATMRITPTLPGRSVQKIPLFYQHVLNQIRSLPGVESAATARDIPLLGANPSVAFSIAGRPVASPGRKPIARYRAISPGYFRTMGIPILKGRDFTDNDSRGAPGVVMIDQEMARRFWPDRNPIGEHIKPATGTIGWCTVVGVVGSVRKGGPWFPVYPTMYYSYLQVSPKDIPLIEGSMRLVVRSPLSPDALRTSITREVVRVSKETPVYNFRTMDEVVSDSLSRARFDTVLLGIFGLLALLMAVVGLYAIISYSVTQRTHEIGIRMALGAEKRDISRMVVGQGLKLALIGVAIGFAGALALTRFLASLLYGVTPTDPLTFIAVSLILIGVALLACYIPARRAAKVDPMVALRYE